MRKLFIKNIKKYLDKCVKKGEILFYFMEIKLFTKNREKYLNRLLLLIRINPIIHIFLIINPILKCNRPFLSL